MAKENLDITNKIVIPGDGNLSSEETREDIVKGLKDLTTEEMDMAAKKFNEEKERRERDSEEERDEEEKGKEELYGNRDAILDNLKENHIKIEEAEMMGYKGKIVKITLPKVGNFGGYPFEYFVSNNEVKQDEFERNPELVEKSYSMKDIGGLLKAMNEYMKAMGVETDGDMDYENDLKLWETGRHSCKAGDCLKECIEDKARLGGRYWLNDKDVGGQKGSRVRWFCSFANCFFLSFDKDFTTHLFLRLSV